MKKKINFSQNYRPEHPTSAGHHKVPSLVFRLLAKILAVAAVVLLAACLVNTCRLGLLPSKYLALLLGAAAVIAALDLFLAFFKKKEIALKSLSILLSIPLIVASLFGFLKVSDTIAFFANFGASSTTSVYNVLVSKNSPLDENSALAGYEVHVYEDLGLDSSLVATAITDSLGAEVDFSSDLLALVSSAASATDYLVAMNSGTYEALVGEDASCGQELKIIRTFEVVSEAEEATDIDVAKAPFTIYISGIDTRTGTLPNRSLSDVNIVAAINPLDKKILLISTPRDYYVHLAGTAPGSLPDKLTHAGSRGGVLLSKATMEELLGIEIDYYARVNFNFVENIVNAIGGINLYSDVPYAFTTNGSGCNFYPGENYVNGACALAFARERKAYSDGDRHRGENQEHVISRILEKLTSSTTLLSSYSDILAALEGTFETSFDMDDVSKFIRAELENMGGWTVTSQNLDGTTGPAPTYSYPSQNLSVMFPDKATVEAARAALQAALGIESESGE